jgi:hypothetical protein
MRKRRKTWFRPGLEPLEPKQTPSATVAAASAAHLAAGRAALHAAPQPHKPPQVKAVPHPRALKQAAAATAAAGKVSASAIKAKFGYLVYRLVNPTPSTGTFTPPFGHVLVQARQPIPGQWYNILWVAVRNNSDQTFDATNSDFKVRLSGQKQYTQILTGDETWKPGETKILYVLTKQYYPLSNQVTGGFEFLLDGAWSVAIPGPSGIFLRIKYSPDTINKILDYALLRGPGSQGGRGLKYGMPVTSIFGFVSAKENRNDFGGLF